MMEKEKKVKICPSAEELEDECKTNVACPIVGCAKTFAQPSALRFHVVKVHKIISVRYFYEYLSIPLINLGRKWTLK